MAKKKLTFKFNFGLVRGLDGRDGIDGKDGVDGINGTNGQNGGSSLIRFTSTGNYNNTPTVDKWNISPGPQWVNSVPSIIPPQVNWMILGEANPDNTMKTPWSDPIRITPLDNHVGPEGPQGIPGKDGKDGEMGPQGIPGRDGKDGKDGKDGIDGISGRDGRDGVDGAQGPQGIPGPAFTMRFTKTSGPNVTPIYNPNSPNPGVIWQATIPPYDPPECIWSIQGQLFNNGDLYSTWSNLYRMTPIDVDQDTIAQMVVYAVQEQIEWEATATSEESPVTSANVELEFNN